MNDMTVPQFPLSPEFLQPAERPQAISTPASADSPVAFTADRPAFRRLVMRGALLELVTAGFYRFWLATDMRRHLWSHTSVEGDAPEYIGTAKELLVGFLFALAILVPIYLGYFLLGLEAERLQAFASIPLVLFFYLSSVRHLSRAPLPADADDLARRALLDDRIRPELRLARRSLVFARLHQPRLCIALGQAALERYKMRHSLWRSSGMFRRHRRRVVQAGLVAVACDRLVCCRSSVCGDRCAAIGPLNPAPRIAPLSSWFFLLFFGRPSATRSTRHRMALVGFRHPLWRRAVSSDLRRGAFIGLYGKVIGWSVLLIDRLSIWLGAAVGAASRCSGPRNRGGAEIDSGAASVACCPLGVGYIACALAFGVVMRMYLRRDVWARGAVVDGVQSSGREHVAAARRAGRRAWRRLCR